MRTITYTSIVFVVAVFSAHLKSIAQLVNPGFETFSQIPTQPGEISLAAGWLKSGGVNSSPDYYHTMAPASADLPETPLAIVESLQGQALMGMMVSGRSGNNTREYVSSKLLTLPQAGRRYQLSFLVTNGQLTAFSPAGLAVNHLGVAFTEEVPITSALQPLNITPVAKLDTVLYSKEWVRVQLEFIAPENARYLTLGLFGNDSEHTIEARDNASAMYAYYFFDDFRLIEMLGTDRPSIDYASKGENAPPAAPERADSPYFIPNSFSPNNDGKNDVFKPVPGTVNHWTFVVFDRWGSEVFRTNDPSAGWDGSCNKGNADVGTYLWRIEFKQYVDGSGWTTVENHGSVTLLR